MKKLLNGGIGAGLEQEDWDFSGCPKEREGECWCYEYAREVPAILAAFDEEKKNPQAFDSPGNWYYEHSWPKDEKPAAITEYQNSRGDWIDQAA